MLAWRRSGFRLACRYSGWLSFPQAERRMTLQCTIQGPIAVLTIDCPPVNAIGADPRSALPAATLSEAAVAFAQEVLRRPLSSLARHRPAALPGNAFWQAAEQRIARKARGAAAPLAALHAVRVGIERGFEEGLAHERATFIQPRQSTEAAAMRRLFFAERANSRLRGSPEPTRPSIARIGIVGAGLMGCGIAAAMVKGGGLPRAEEALRAIFAGEAKRGDNPQRVDQRLAMVRFDMGPNSVRDCHQGVAGAAADIDLVQVLGYGSPRHRGGPMFATGRFGPAEARSSNTGGLQ